MTLSARLRLVALAAALCAVAAFVVSFALGLRGDPADSAVDGDPLAALARMREPRVRVEVLNAAGRAGLAREATQRLRDHGFDVVFFGNAREFGRDSSVVLDRVGTIEVAREVAEALGIAAVRSEPDTTLLLEVTVVLGKDWPPRGDQAATGWRERRSSRSRPTGD